MKTADRFTGISHLSNVTSEYFTSDFWEDRNAKTSEGDLSRDSLFIKWVDRSSLATASGIIHFTYCNTFEFAAGYLKHYILCRILHHLFDSKAISRLTKGKNFIFDIDSFSKTFGAVDRENEKVMKKVTDILQLCNRIFAEESEKEKAKLLFSALYKLCEHFPKEKDCYIEFKIHDGIENAKDEIFNCMKVDDPDLEEHISYCINRKVWREEEKIIIKKALGDIV